MIWGPWAWRETLTPTRDQRRKRARVDRTKVKAARKAARRNR